MRSFSRVEARQPASRRRGRWARCRLIEISENLHRAELTALERSKLVAEGVELTGEVLVQGEPKPQGGRPRGGVREAERQLGVERTEVRRALKVASLSPEAQDAAREAGLDNNRSAGHRHFVLSNRPRLAFSSAL